MRFPLVLLGSLLISHVTQAALPLDGATVLYRETFAGETGHSLTDEVGAGTSVDASSPNGTVAFTGVADLSVQSSLDAIGLESAAFFVSLDAPLPPVLEFDFVARFDAFLSRPTITLVMDDEIVVVPSSSIRHFSITRASKLLSIDALDAIPGVLLGVKRIVG